MVYFKETSVTIDGNQQYISDISKALRKEDDFRAICTPNNELVVLKFFDKNYNLLSADTVVEGLPKEDGLLKIYAKVQQTSTNTCMIVTNLLPSFSSQLLTIANFNTLSRGYSLLRRGFHVNGVIDYTKQNTVFYVNPLINCSDLMKSVYEGNWIMLHGPRSSGKSTRVVSLMNEISRDFISFRVSLQSSFGFKTPSNFWSSFSQELRNHYPHYFGTISFHDSAGFTKLFATSSLFEGKKVVLILDEFDQIYFHSSSPVCDEILNIFRSLRDTQSTHTLHSMIAVGPFSILQANNKTGSPFNVKHAISNPDFTLEMTEELFSQFENERNITLDKKIILDIHNRTKGHAGLINMCGTIIDCSIPRPTNHITHALWIQNEAKILTELNRYGTTQRIIDAVITNRDVEKHTGLSIPLYKDIIYITMSLLRSSDPIICENVLCANYLVSEGLASYIESENRFSIKSPLIQQFLLSHITSFHPRNFPITPFPLTKDYQIIIPSLVVGAVSSFSKNDLLNSLICAQKVFHNTNVPCEATYHEELYSIISSWRGPYQYSINTNVKVISENNSKRCDLLLASNHWRYCLEIVAHAPLGNESTPGSVIEHCYRTSQFYHNQLNSNQSWVINFTIDNSTTNYFSNYPNVKIIHVLHKIDCIQFTIKVQQENNTFIESIVSLK
ncbi:eukaryotic translation initiation factor 2A [Tieghemostelium lacteum]|uniref:Eukaryotic translation initiation factor 2A n=1 Tax=Tieghemostelium lacteum TaxID=361077 RepID=A0A152A5P1_TIELA|nr:eukaryotic translation initiation factor 2A [Tieghemostelium lacteum]|eukprot:KYR01549.1 eukaryotic translation initiation factor 2A [Tieghemostelium lacteum]